jgi:hypothetical protein
MRISFEVNVKAVLVVTVVAGLSVGSFYAGMRHQKHKDMRPEGTATTTTDADPFAAIAKPIKAGDTLIIPNSEAIDNEMSWCKAHPSTKWTFPSATVEQVRNLPAGSAVMPVSGGCDAAGQVWVISDHK